jgi:small subunit ribosomal protein S21
MEKFYARWGYSGLAGKRLRFDNAFRTIYKFFGCNQRILVLSRLGLFGGVFFLAEVRVQEGEPLENALRRFKRKVQTEDIIKEVKRHSFYLKPGEKKRVKEALARKRNRKKVRKEQD